MSKSIMKGIATKTATQVPANASPLTLKTYHASPSSLKSFPFMPNFTANCVNMQPRVPMIPTPRAWKRRVAPFSKCTVSSSSKMSWLSHADSMNGLELLTTSKYAFLPMGPNTPSYKLTQQQQQAPIIRPIGLPSIRATPVIDPNTNLNGKAKLQASEPSAMLPRWYRKHTPIAFRARNFGMTTWSMSFLKPPLKYHTCVVYMTTKWDTAAHQCISHQKTKTKNIAIATSPCEYSSVGVTMSRANKDEMRLPTVRNQKTIINLNAIVMTGCINNDGVVKITWNAHSKQLMAISTLPACVHKNNVKIKPSKMQATPHIIL
mmetsp:Transcript_42079/g.120304  ORF Transcript_42079/g.120304 Transcript_42079/m.120304 type:complete len:319 (+) Transcript_42079:463-1419(+)